MLPRIEYLSLKYLEGSFEISAHKHKDDRAACLAHEEVYQGAVHTVRILCSRQIFGLLLNNH